jgi:uncharacterized membrane protein (DUF4010 family)
MIELVKEIPAVLLNFLLVTVFSLLIGLSQRQLHTLAGQQERTFGTDRTFTFIGILGFLLYLLDPQGLYLFLGGGLILSVFMGINYFNNLRKYDDHGITTIVIALITYCIAPLLMTQPTWMVILVIVTVLIFTELKESFLQISQKFNKDEFLNLAKFLIIAGVILPIVPDEPVFRNITLTPYKVWLAVVVVSTISYLSYLLKKFVFRKGSILFSGILGGLYSSTATTIILARKSRKEPLARNQYIAAILFATAMMYLRILALILIFNRELFLAVYFYFILLFFISALIGTGILLYRNRQYSALDSELTDDKNPLEFRVALLFMALYVAFTFITYFVVSRFGVPGLNILSYIVGLTDIDPFLLNLFQGKFGVGTMVIATATLQAIISNNVLKMIYACFFMERKNWIFVIAGFLLVILLNLVFVFIV